MIKKVRTIGSGKESKTKGEFNFAYEKDNTFYIGDFYNKRIQYFALTSIIRRRTIRIIIRTIRIIILII